MSIPTFLIVDDSATARKIISDALSQRKIHVIEAADGNQALEALKSHPEISVIFSDINMPWMDGLEMVAKIKANPAFKDIPICMLTSESAPEALQKAKNLGVNAFLVKPVQPKHLDAVLSTFLVA